jgi:hypothetical protein
LVEVPTAKGRLMAFRATEVSAVSEELLITGGAETQFNGVVDCAISASNHHLAHTLDFYVASNLD